ncbi:MAG: tol-pal system protein YbgF [Acidobacteriota bacterium]
MKQTGSRVVVALLFASALARPAAAANKEQQQLMADVRMLQEQSQQLQNLIGALNTTMSEALKAINARLDEQAGNNRKSFADQKLTVDTLSSDLKVVREKVDDNNVRIGSLSQEVDALRQGLQQLNAARPPAPAPSDTADGAIAPVEAPPNAAAPPALPIGTSPQRLYEQASGSYSAGLYDLAIEGFQAYIRSFPKSDMADDAQLQIGHSYLAQGKNDKAVEEYDKVIRTYPGGNAVPDAYYKKGIALADLKQLEQAREAFETAARNFPDSTAAMLAKQRLTALAPR